MFVYFRHLRNVLSIQLLLRDKQKPNPRAKNKIKIKHKIEKSWREGGRWRWHGSVLAEEDEYVAFGWTRWIVDEEWRWRAGIVVTIHNLVICADHDFSSTANSCVPTAICHPVVRNCMSSFRGPAIYLNTTRNWRKQEFRWTRWLDGCETNEKHL